MCGFTPVFYVHNMCITDVLNMYHRCINCMCYKLISTTHVLYMCTGHNQSSHTRCTDLPTVHGVSPTQCYLQEMFDCVQVVMSEL